MSMLECIGPIKVAMKIRRDAIDTAAETLNSIYNQPNSPDQLIEQV